MEYCGHHICGIDELGLAPLTTARRVVSILEPGAPLPPELVALEADVLALRFDDIIDAHPKYVLPARDHLEQLLAFDRGHDPDDQLVIHCRAGVSRSTAAFVALLAQRRPGDEAAIFAELRAVRPPAWPNSRMVELADDVLGAGGRLTAALRDHYKVQLRAHPEIGRMMISLGREREIPFDRFVPE